MAPKRPETMTDNLWWSLSVCETQLNALFPFLVLFGAHILSFYEWKIFQQLLGDNSDVTCVSIGKSTRNIYVERYNSVFSVSQGSVEALIRWSGKA